MTFIPSSPLADMRTLSSSFGTVCYVRGGKQAIGAACELFKREDRRDNIRGSEVRPERRCIRPATRRRRCLLTPGFINR